MEKNKALEVEAYRRVFFRNHNRRLGLIGFAGAKPRCLETPLFLLFILHMVMMGVFIKFIASSETPVTV